MKEQKNNLGWVQIINELNKEKPRISQEKEDEQNKNNK